MSQPAQFDPDKYADDCTKIVPEVLQEEFVRLPADLAYWNARYAQTYQFWLESKLARERECARLYALHQAKLMTAGKGKVTISEVESSMNQDQAFVDVRTKEIIAESEKIRIAGVVEAIRAKRDMLISIGAHQRAEMQNDPMIRQARDVEREVRGG